MQITRTWAMPNSKTFTIKPIKEIVERECSKATIIIDPFANACKYGTITNDLNPEFDTTFHLDALQFLKQIKTMCADLVLYDPPYSITQAAQMYKSYGKDKLRTSVSNMKYWAECKNEIARICKVGGYIPIILSLQCEADPTRYPISTPNNLNQDLTDVPTQ